jgi:protease II
MVMPKNILTVVEADHMVKIIQFEVFKNYLAIIQERNGIRELKTVNLMTQKQYVHQFDQPPELSPSDQKRPQFYDVKLEDNLSFDATSVRYVLSTPSCPDRRLSFNMGTKKSSLLT